MHHQSFTSPTFQDRFVKEAERKQITQVSRSQAYKLEKANKYPKRVQLSTRSVAWRLSELIAWVESRTQSRFS
ncbi:helix-turn-helix transcriptional regulator [Vibrio ulleungensis]|uniref:AlpA family phage regulatory protein n=1 Tax=Vibrio ulleungensis TaxID=2807619 RepID=A0ABS2HL54_9VIBR|nr:AlpA family phage regulatory protein [Vibrio ulleungensis]MBM7038210.1 AlpA family phage regulatory protein [Vibrio ulleungensis]